ncbi:MAG: carboxypeptidase regulatory-like domain-containing protein, partial [Terriglobia bacterium]
LKPRPSGLRCLVASAILISILAWNAHIGSAQDVQGSVTGIVRSTAGEPLPGAKLILKEGDAILSAVSGKNGAYRFAPTHEGVYTLEVHCAGYADATETAAATAKNRQLTLNFVLKPLSNPKAQPATPRGPLGAVGFYESSPFETGQLKDPTAGGGYSDSASIAGAAMVRQYLIPGPSLLPPSNGRSSKSAAGGNPSSPAGTSAGAEMLARRDFVHAAAWFRNALAHRPQSARAQMGLGISLYGEGKYGAAVEALSHAASLSPDDPAPRLLLAEAAQFAPHRQPEVARLLRRFTETHPANAEGHYAYAMDLWEIFRLRHAQQTLAQARAENEKAVALTPGFAAAHFQLGILYDQERMTAPAIQQYREAIRLNPALSTAHYRLAQDLLHSGARVEARTEMDSYEKLRDKSHR